MFQDAGVWGAKPSLATSYKYKRQVAKELKQALNTKAGKKVEQQIQYLQEQLA